MAKRFFTSESVTEGHPDKVCDQIADAILDEILANDPAARVACESLATTGVVIVAGEVSTECYADVEKAARRVIADIGYNRPEYGFDAGSLAVLTHVKEQSPDIARGVDAGLESRGGSVHETGAGDQGMMFGFAARETPSLMPMPIEFAHRIAKKLAAVRKSGKLPYLRPDGKAQVTIEYEDGSPKRVDCVVVSAQHDPDILPEELAADIRRSVIGEVIPPELLDSDTRYFINPTGSFVVGGPMGDCGLTGRKIIVDTYGGYARHGGGSFSGKDPTKVDRSAAYMARYAAKNAVARGLADKCEIQLAYAIGVSNPVSVMVDTFGTGKTPDDEIARRLTAKLDFTPDGIIRRFGLRRPIYLQTAAYGHFGRDDLDLPWENTDLDL
ncbi:MAG: methionine adenosyltransferase [Clostridiales bacterium]|jgi:S-adenosylmethionine synthetase|nr:methionine adenosyltransferase [Clostridiales bacterium]